MKPCSPFSEKKITVIGAAILDILAGPVDSGIFSSGSQSMSTIKMSFGGDALNETLALAKLGKSVDLITLLGRDDAGQKILDTLHSHGVSSSFVTIDENLETGMNLVLVDPAGERYFLTNPSSSLRKLSESDILPYLDQAGDIVSFASLFVSFSLDLPAMERICRKIKEKPERILVLDMTKPKHGEKLEDLKELLPYIDYILPNQDEIAMLTGEENPRKNAELLINAGVSHAVIKCGKSGCILATAGGIEEISAYPVAHPVDSTGAGDCFAAGLLWALSNGWDPRESCRFACAAASCSVEHFGATDGIISSEQILSRYFL